MVVEMDDKEEQTDETAETPSDYGALIGWLGAMHSEIRAQRGEMREMRSEFREEMREMRVEIRGEIRGLSERTGRLEERVTRIEADIEAERRRKNRWIMWLGVGAAVLFGVGGTIIGVIGLLN